jgi:hypothetical protein
MGADRCNFLPVFCQHISDFSARIHGEHGIFDSMQKFWKRGARSAGIDLHLIRQRWITGSVAGGLAVAFLTGLTVGLLQVRRKRKEVVAGTIRNRKNGAK